MRTEYQGKKAMPRGNYIPAALQKYCLNGDAFIKIEDAYDICSNGRIPYRVFEEDMAYQCKLGKIHREGTRLYLKKMWRHENAAANALVGILQNNEAVCPELSDDLAQDDGIQLNEEQCAAVRMALSHRLSIILGGAGTGKTTLIKKIIYEYHKLGYVLCAPTGKAAHNLTERTGYHGRTVHSALGIHSDEDERSSSVQWEYIGLVVVDEASMLTIELLSGLLSKVREGCRIVLIGDTNQLLAVGSGRVLTDLQALDIPCVRLRQNYRQADEETALFRNVVYFADICSDADLCFDDSFRLLESNERDAETAIIEEAVSRHEAGESVQVLSPYNAKTRLSVASLNRVLQDRINPRGVGKKELVTTSGIFRDGDRVVIMKNDSRHDCANGDSGIFKIEDDDKDMPIYHVELPNGHCPRWGGWEALELLSLAYAITVHKSQGSQYDTVLIPVIDCFSGMLYRNLMYTAISRAKSTVILFGSRNALDMAVKTDAKPRRSMLTAKTRMLMERCA